MIGYDIENNIFPPPVGPIPPLLPYLSVSILSGSTLIFGNGYFTKYTEKTYALKEGIRIMQKGTDCGWLGVLHIGNLANILYPVILGFSKSKSHFGCASVKRKANPLRLQL